MMRFYGLSPGDLDEMDLEDFWMCAEAMDRITADERLQAMQAASAPYIKGKDRDRLINKLSRIADPDAYEQKAITHEDMARLLNG